MEEKLKILFDYQKYQGSERLAQLIADTEQRYFCCLSDDDLELVSAAGSPDPLKKTEDDPFD